MNSFPKKIHLIYWPFNPDDSMPEQWKLNLDAWKTQKKNFKVTLWDLQQIEKLIEEVDSDFLTLFNNYQYPIQKADAGRYFILKKYGGVYVDLDTYPNRDLLPLVNVYDVEEIDVAFGSSSATDEPSNYFIISRPNAPFWDIVIKKLKQRAKKKYWGKHSTVYKTTGPQLIKDSIKELNSDSVVQIPNSLLSTVDFCSNKSKNKYVEFIIDQHAKSWNNGDSSFFNWLYCFLKPLKNLSFPHAIFIVAIIIIVSLIMAYLFLKCKRRLRGKCK